MVKYYFEIRHRKKGKWVLIRKILTLNIEYNELVRKPLEDIAEICGIKIKNIGEIDYMKLTTNI